PLAPKIREMERRVHNKLKRHKEGRDRVKWYNAKTHKLEEEKLEKILRVWTRVALTATALSTTKTKSVEKKEEVCSSAAKKQKEVKTGRAQTTPSAPPPLQAYPTSLYPKLSQPPPYNEHHNTVQAHTAASVSRNS
ncbi:MAG: hypothetical protein ACRDDA_00150, partial [Aeromonas sp.]